MEWISVKDKLPGPYDTVLLAIRTSNGYNEPVYYIAQGGLDYKDGERKWARYGVGFAIVDPGETVTHWMPPPEPPEDDDDEDEAN